MVRGDGVTTSSRSILFIGSSPARTASHSAAVCSIKTKKDYIESCQDQGSKTMRYWSQVKPISYLKANAAEVLTRLSEQREPLVITQNGEAKAMLQ